MATQNQIRANRANAKSSTGPKTAEGKKISAKNSTRHGMVAETVVLDGESDERFKELLADFTLQLKPRTAAESAIVETMAIARWKQMRIWGIQKAGFNLEMAELRSNCNVPATRGYMVFKKLADTSRVLDLQYRYETGYDRQFCRAFSFFLKLREKPETQLEDADFTQMSFSFATATWEPGPEEIKYETQEAAEPPQDEPPTPESAETTPPPPVEAPEITPVPTPKLVLRNKPNFPSTPAPQAASLPEKRPAKPSQNSPSERDVINS